MLRNEVRGYIGTHGCNRMLGHTVYLLHTAPHWLGIYGSLLVVRSIVRTRHIHVLDLLWTGGIFSYGMPAGLDRQLRNLRPHTHVVFLSISAERVGFDRIDCREDAGETHPA